jgi:hypothetical protein
MSRTRAVVLVCLLALLTPVAHAGKHKVGYMKQPGSAEVTGLTLVPAGGDCANWAWAAAAQSILALDNVQVDQHVLLQKAYGGEVCDDRLDLRALADVVNGDYQLGPKNGMKVVTRVFPAGAPLAEALIAGVKHNRPMIVVYRGHPYVAIRVDYDEYIGPNGSRLWDARLITLLDPTATDEEHRRIVFDKNADDAGEFSGATDFSLFPTEQVDWLPPQ